MKTLWASAGVIVGLGAILAGCATAPDTRAERRSLQSNAEATLDTMTARDDTLGQRLQESHAYVVFPTVGKAGAIVGGAYGRGVVYEDGRMVGYAELNQAGIGAQLGAQTFAQLVLFRDRRAFDEFKRGGWEVRGTASAVVLTAGAGAAIDFGKHGTAIVLMPRGGLMVDVSVSGQEINYQPAEG